MASRPIALTPITMVFKFLSAFVFVSVLLSEGAECWPWSSAAGKGDIPNLNWVVDDIITAMSDEITKQHGQQMEIPGSDVNWRQSLNFYILWIEAYGSAVSQEKAIIRNLNNIARISDAGILQEAKNEDSELVTLQAQIRVSDLEVSYSNIDLLLWFVTYSGGLTVKCPDNIFDITVQFDNGETCTSKLKSAVIKDLSSCTVELDKSGALNWFKKHIISYAFRQIVNNVQDYQNKNLPSVLDAIIQNHKICKFLNPSADD